MVKVRKKRTRQKVKHTEKLSNTVKHNGLPRKTVSKLPSKVTKSTADIRSGRPLKDSSSTKRVVLPKWEL